MDYSEDDMGATPHVSEAEVEAESEALERLARAGHWQRCLAHAGVKAPHYALRYAAQLFKSHPVSKVSIFSRNVNFVTL